MDVSDKTSAPNGLFSLPTLSASKGDDLLLTVRKDGYHLANPFSGASNYKVSAGQRGSFLVIKMIAKPFPNGKKTIAVLPFCDDSSGEHPLIEGAFTAKAAEALNYVDRQLLEVIPHMRVWTAMQNQRMNWDQYCDINQIAGLSAQLGANVVVLGMYKKDLNQKWKLNCTFYDLSENKPFFRDIFITEDNLVLLQQKMYEEILKKLEVGVDMSRSTLTDKAKKAVESHTTAATQNEASFASDLNANQYLAQAQPQQAEAQAQKAAQQDPKNYLSGLTLSRAFQSQGRKTEAQTQLNRFTKIASERSIDINAFNPFDLPPAPRSFTQTVNGVSFKMIFVEGGSFRMGDTFGEGESDEKPVHDVVLSGYYLGETEVTQALWRAVMGSDPPELYFKGCDQCPVGGVSWEDIVKEFLPKLNRLTGRTYVLPTEAQWEFAARERGRSVRFGNGQNILRPSEANFYAKEDGKEPYSESGTYRGKTMPVKSFSPNSLDLYDMAGNVWEWCSDWYGNYSSSPTRDPQGPASGTYRVFRGGSWNYSPEGVRSSNRGSYAPTDRRNYIGFRLAVLL